MKTTPLFLVSLVLGCGGSDKAQSEAQDNDSRSETQPSGTTDTDESDDTGTPEDTAEPGDSDDTGQINDTGSLDDTGTPPTPDNPSVFLLTVSNEPDPADFLFLSAIPASAKINGGTPAVIAVDDMTNLKPGTLDLLNRLEPETHITTNATAIDTDIHLTQLPGDDPQTWSLALAETYWTEPEFAVVVSDLDYSAATLGASMAARLDAPLVVAGSDGDTLNTSLNELTTHVLSIGIDSAAPMLTTDHTLLNGLDSILAWVVENDGGVDYLTISNTNDRLSGRSQKASMMAPMYAVNRGGLSIPMALPMPTLVVDDGGAHPVLPFLSEIYDHLGGPPSHLAIVGAHDALPQMRKPSIFDNPIEEQPVSDLPYAEIDDDAFIDISIGRIVGDTVEELAAIATRTAQYTRLQDGIWERNIVEAGLWGFDELRSINTNVDFEPSRHLTQEEIETAGSLEIAAFLHKDHSYCQILGHAVDINTPTLFAPAITVSRGCSVGGMDLLRDDQRSIVDHLFGQGIVAFVGAARNAIAYNTIIEVSLWNQLLEGQTLGESFKHGINDAIVHWLDDGSSAMRYSIDTEIVYGDPAFRLFVPGPHRTQPAAQHFDGSTLTVTAPELWTVVPYHPEQLAEWGYGGELFMYTAPGAIPRTYWAGSYDNEDMYFGVQLQLDEAPSSVTQVDSYPSPLGWGGNFHIDHHADGTASALWRVRLLDFDPENGILIAEEDTFTYAVD